MSKKFLTPINLLSRDTDPEEGFNGDIYFNTTLNKIKLYSSSAWNVISPSSSVTGTTIGVSDTPPVSPSTNSLWYESDTGDLFIYYDSYWVQLNSGGVDQNYLDSTASAIGQRLLASTASTLYLGINNTANHASTASSIAGSLVTGIVNNASHANTASSINWSGITNTPTTLLGYGITDGLRSSDAASAYITVKYLEWTTQTSNFGTGFGSDIFSVAYGNSLWVAVGDNGRIRTSTDTIDWTTQTSNITFPIYSVAYGNGLWVAGSIFGEIRSSTDGITWVTRTSNFTGEITSVAYGNGLWAIGGENAQIRTSTDAITWVTRTSNFGTSYIWSISYGNGVWVAGGQNGSLRTSTDAITWVTQTSNIEFNQILDSQYGNNIWVIVGGTGNLRTSTDAITWVTQTSNFGDTTIDTVAYGNGLWFAGGRLGTLRSSTNGTTWVTETSNFGTNNIYSIANNDNLWVAGGRYGQLRTYNTNLVDVSKSAFALHANTASSIAGLLITGPVASANFSLFANSASSIDWSNVTNTPDPIIGINLTGIVTGAASGTLTDLTNSQISITTQANAIINPISSSPTYNLVLSDAGELIELNHSSSVRVVIPLNSTVDFPIGTTIDILQTGPGQVTASYVSGVTLNSNGGAVTLTGQWSAASLIKRQTDTWVLIGDITV